MKGKSASALRTSALADASHRRIVSAVISGASTIRPRRCAEHYRALEARQHDKANNIEQSTANT